MLLAPPPKKKLSLLLNLPCNAAVVTMCVLQVSGEERPVPVRVRHDQRGLYSQPLLHVQVADIGIGRLTDR